MDFEKIRILKDLAAKSANKNISQLWKKFDEHLKVFTIEHDFDEKKITDEVNTGKAMVDELSDKLGELH